MEDCKINSLHKSECANSANFPEQLQEITNKVEQKLQELIDRFSDLHQSIKPFQDDEQSTKLYQDYEQSLYDNLKILGMENVQDYLLNMPHFQSEQERFLLQTSVVRKEEITASDLDKDSIPLIKEEFKQVLPIMISDAYTNRTNVSCQSVNPSFTVDNLIPEKKKEYDLFLKGFAERRLEIILDSFFNQGKSFLKIMQDNLTEKFKLDDCCTFGPEDFINYREGQFYTPRKSHRDSDALIRALHKQKCKKQKQATQTLINKLRDPITIRKHIFAAKTFQLKMNELSEDNIYNVEEKFLEQEEIRKQKIRDELIREEEVQASKKKSIHNSTSLSKSTKKSRKNGLKSHVLKEEITSAKKDSNQEQQSQGKLSQMMNELLSRPYKDRKFQLHGRVSGWKKITHDRLQDIKNFGAPYDQYDDTQLDYMLACHKLSGIERILSEKSLKNQYSFSYPITQKFDNDKRKGKGFYTVMQRTVKGEKLATQTGMTYVAYYKNDNKKIVYHAMFEPFSSLDEPISFLEEIKQQFDNDSFTQTIPRFGAEESNNEEWENSREVSFNFDLNDRIIMQVGKKPKNRINFTFEPLDRF